MRVFGAFRRGLSSSSSSSMSQFGEEAERELVSLLVGAESVLEELEGADVELKDGVLTLVLPMNRGSFVVNKQTPTQQLWWSSPVSGPRRYAQTGGPGTPWKCVRSGSELRSDLARELAMLLPEAKAVQYHD